MQHRQRKSKIKNAQTYKVQSLQRAFDLLEAFPAIGPEIGLSTMAKYVGLNKSTTYRLLSTLESRGYIERSPYDRSYRLGVRIFELGAYYQNQINVRRMAIPILTSLVEETHETAFLCIREEDEALCIERLEAEQEIQIFALRIGGRLPLHSGAAPRVLLSGLEKSEIEAYAKRTKLQSLTPKTISRVEDLFADVEKTRHQGYALSDEDVTLGMAAIGAPVRDYSGNIVAAISISGLLRSFDGPRRRSLAECVIKAADKISKHMGYAGQ